MEDVDLPVRSCNQDVEAIILFLDVMAVHLEGHDLGEGCSSDDMIGISNVTFPNGNRLYLPNDTLIKLCRAAMNKNEHASVNLDGICGNMKTCYSWYIVVFARA